AAVPFQMWAPDVYEGAPTPVTAFLSVGSKAAGFALLLRVFQTAFAFAPIEWPTLFAILAVLSMTVGNVVALMQTNIKRMMAYSSIAQAGYVLVGVAALQMPAFGAFSEAPLLGASGVIFFLLSYTLTNLGAFAVIIAISNKVGSDRIEDYSGMARRSPILTLALTICMISLVGIPPTAGFVAKFYLFNAAVQGGLTWLVIIGVINSVISAAYYIRVVKVMYFGAAASEESVPAPGFLATAMTLALVGVVILGIYPSPLFDWAQVASRNLFP
ncbi:MAG: NADH-quinone oxidoreductase subunit N, partial [Chloroflexota bacterium]